MAIEYACERCSGTGVTADAWMEWDIPRQAWVVATIFEYGFCHECSRATRLFGRAIVKE